MGAATVQVSPSWDEIQVHLATDVVSKTLLDQPRPEAPFAGFFTGGPPSSVHRICSLRVPFTPVMVHTIPTCPRSLERAPYFTALVQSSCSAIEARAPASPKARPGAFDFEAVLCDSPIGRDRLLRDLRERRAFQLWRARMLWAFDNAIKGH
jgi:hypothetical protein